MRHLAVTLLVVPFAVMTLSSPAQALEECESDSDCAAGFVCDVVAASTCVDVECPPGEECPDPLPCDDETFSACVPGPCASDADCGEGLSCIAVSYEDCVAAPCSSEEECDDIDVECEEIVENYCLPSYVLPCSADSDCGEGFECIPLEECVCEGGGDVPRPEDPEGDDDTDDPEPEPRDDGDDDDFDCSCSPTEESYCAPIEATCESDAECPEGWSCEEEPVAVSCSYNAETGEEICDEPEEGESMCMPPFWDFGWYEGGIDEDDVSALDAATGGENARATGPARSLEEGASAGCSSVPGAPGAALGLTWLIPLLINRLRRR